MGEKVTVTLEEDSYYTLLELKGKLKAKTYKELIEKLEKITDEYLATRGPAPLY